MRRSIGGIAATLLVLAATPARAAGGAHVVDDAAVENPGLCHVESWATFASQGSGLVSVAPGCTRRAWRNLEIGGFVAHGWTRTTGDTTIGLTPKLALSSEERGVGIAISASAAYGLDRSRLEAASVIVPVTIPAGERLRLSLNAGWHWTRAGRHHDAFAGAQVELALSSNLGLMAEAFARDRGKAGAQAGLRWTVAGGRVDLDLLAGRYVDGATATAVTIGVTLRR